MDLNTWELIHSLGTSTFDNFLFDYYAQINITDLEFVVILQIIKAQNHENKFITAKEIAQKTNLNEAEVGQLIQSLIDKELLEIVQENSANNLIIDRYSFKLLNQKIINYLLENELVKTHDQEHLVPKTKVDPVQDLIRRFEIEFGRLLTPIERQTILGWVKEDNYQIDVIVLALIEAVLSQVYNLKYVDRILLNWQKRNLKTVDQVTNYMNNHR